MSNAMLVNHWSSLAERGRLDFLKKLKLKEICVSAVDVGEDLAEFDRLAKKAGLSAVYKATAAGEQEAVVGVIFSGKYKKRQFK